MAHFAKVNNKIVTKVLVAEQDFIDSYIDNEPGVWIKTSYNTHGGVHYQEDGITPSADQTKALRKNYAGIGFTYDEGRDAFIPPKPYESFVLDETKCLWEPPITFPTIINDGEDPVVWRWQISWDEIGYRINQKGWKAYKQNVDGTTHSDTNTYYWNGTAWTT